MPFCVYCGQTVTEEHPVSFGADGKKSAACSAACAVKTEAFMTYYAKHKKHFILGLFLSMACLVTAVILMGVKVTAAGSILMGAALVLLGLTTYLMPFATPQTFEMFCVRTALRVTRAIGVGAAVLGIAFAVLVLTVG